MLLADVAAASASVAGTASRSAKVGLLAGALRAAAPNEVPVVLAFLAGAPRQRRTGVGWAALRDRPAPAQVAGLLVSEVDEAFAGLEGLSGPGSTAARRARLSALLARATKQEQQLLVGLVAGELRQGAQQALVVEALAQASALPLAAIRSAVMLAGAPGPVAQAALSGAGLGAFALQVGRPVAPMLAQPGGDLTAALARVAPAVVEAKLDGIRVQVHRDDDQVWVFSRSLVDITGQLPDVVQAVRQLPARRLVLDGEALALRPDGRPQPFQVSATRGARLQPFLFDLLHHDGAELLGAPLRDRSAALAALVPAGRRVAAVRTEDPAVAGEFRDEVLARGHEGVVVKALDSLYDAGRRGGAWQKVKPVHTLDLVVLAAEWGHGRRTGLLSNLHLGSREQVMLGKTFKGLTDALLRWQTERLLALAEGTEPWGVRARPELVVEVAVDGVQRSTRYPGGVALRFARVVRYREDKPPAEADTLESVRGLLP